MNDQAPGSIRQIIRASAISGAGSMVFIASGIVKTKIIALFLGPSGVGLFGLFQSILSTFGTISAAGLGNSGIRQIAVTRASNQPDQLAITRSALVLGTVLLGIAGMAAVIAFREPIARLTLGDDRYAGDVVILGFGIWCFVVTTAQTGLLNGMHRIGDLARASIAGSLISLPITFALVWFFRDRGISTAVTLTALSTLAASWWYQRKLDIPRIDLTWGRIQGPLQMLIGLGVVLMAASLLTTGSQLLARVIITRSMHVEATGYFQAAWSISMLYLGFALNAMGTDYYPRLTAAAHDHPAANTMMNEQLQVALTLTGPVILLMLTFAPQVVHLLFSDAFGETVDILRLQLLGDVLKVASWPLSYLFPSLGHVRHFFALELCWNTAYIGLLLLGLPVWGLRAAGIAYAGAYVVYFIVVLTMIRRLRRFSFTLMNKKLIVMQLLSVLTIFLISRYDTVPGYLFALCIAGAAAYYSFSRLAREVGGVSLTRILKRP